MIIPLIIPVFLFTNCTSEKASSNRDTPPVPTQHAVVDHKSKIAAEQWETELNQQILTGLSFIKNFPPDSFWKSSKSISIAIDSFDRFASLYLLSMGNYSDNFLKNAQQLGAETKKLQQKVFPLLRKNFTQQMADEMRKFDIEVSCTGKDNSILTLTGEIFSKNKNISDFQNTLDNSSYKKPPAKHFRFKEIRYAWHKNQSDPVVFEIHSLPDNKLSTEAE